METAVITRSFDTVKRHLMYVAVRDYRPFNISAGVGMKDMIVGLTGQAKVASPGTLKNEMMAEHAAKSIQLRRFLQERVDYHFLIIDGRKDPVHGYPNFALIVVAACRLSNKHIQVPLRVVRPISKTAEVQAASIREMYRDFATVLDFTKLLAIVGDGADKATADKLQKDFLVCFGHCTANDAKNALIKVDLYRKKKTPNVNDALINKTAKMIRRVKNRYKLNMEYDRLRNIHNAEHPNEPQINRLKLFCVTRLLGAVGTIDSVVTALPVLLEMQRMADAQRRTDPWKAWVHLNRSELSVLKELAPMLRPMEQMMTDAGAAHHLTLSSVYFAQYEQLYRMVHSPEPRQPVVVSLKEELSGSLRVRLEEYRKSPLVASCTLLHPFFRNFRSLPAVATEDEKTRFEPLFRYISAEKIQVKHSENNIEEVFLVDHWKHILCHWVRARFSRWWQDNVEKPDPLTHSYGRISQTTFYNELTFFLSAPPHMMQVHHDTDLLSFWRDAKNTFPLVSWVATRLVVCPATSFSVERLWSAVGRVLDKRRAALRYDTMEAQVLLHELYCFAERFGEGAEALLFRADEKPREMDQVDQVFSE